MNQILKMFFWHISKIKIVFFEALKVFKLVGNLINVLLQNLEVKLLGFASVLDYYYHISSEHYIDKIITPTLSINCREDPISRIENVPIEKLYKNPYIINLITERGGHIEYLSGFEADWWGYTIALEYFQFFENL